MSQPTPLSPWFVVQRQRPDGHTEYYQSAAEGDGSFTTRKTFAMLFMSLSSAGRVADASEGEVRALYSKSHATEYGRS